MCWNNKIPDKVFFYEAVFAFFFSTFPQATKRPRMPFFPKATVALCLWQVCFYGVQVKSERNGQVYTNNVNV